MNLQYKNSEFYFKFWLEGKNKSTDKERSFINDSMRILTVNEWN